MPHDKDGKAACDIIAEKLSGEKYEEVAPREDTDRPTAGHLDIQSTLLLTCVLDCSRSCEKYTNGPKCKLRNPKASSHKHRDFAQALVLENYVPNQASKAS
jgi:hypothetical protein